jgi:transposase
VEKITRIFTDTSKQFFQLHGVDADEKVVVRRQLRRNQVLAFFGKLEPTVVGLEACGGSHHLARELVALGHEGCRHSALRAPAGNDVSCFPTDLSSL